MKIRRACLGAVATGLLSIGLLAQPAFADTTNTWVVKPGDSLWKISVATGVSIADIAQANQIQNINVIYSGEVLQIPSKQSILQNHVVATANQYLGVPYLWGGTSPSGFDCSGFTEYVFLKNGITLPRNSAAQYGVGTSVSKNDLQKGDLVFFDDTYRSGISHVGIYVGSGNFIHASSSQGIMISSLSNVYWAAHYYGAKRVITG